MVRDRSVAQTRRERWMNLQISGIEKEWFLCWWNHGKPCITCDIVKFFGFRRTDTTKILIQKRRPNGEMNEVKEVCSDHIRTFLLEKMIDGCNVNLFHIWCQRFQTEDNTATFDICDRINDHHGYCSVAEHSLALTFRIGIETFALIIWIGNVSIEEPSEFLANFDKSSRWLWSKWIVERDHIWIS